LDAFIIDELKRREENEKREDLRPRLELPVSHREDLPFRYSEPEEDDEGIERDRGDRGVVVIDL